MDIDPQHTQTYLIPSSAETLLRWAQAWKTPLSTASAAVLLFLERELNVYSHFALQLQCVTEWLLGIQSVHGILVGWLQWPQCSCAMTLPVGCFSEASPSCTSLTYRACDGNFKRLPSSVFHVCHLPENDAPQQGPSQPFWLIVECSSMNLPAITLGIGDSMSHVVQAYIHLCCS